MKRKKKAKIRVGKNELDILKYLDRTTRKTVKTKHIKYAISTAGWSRNIWSTSVGLERKRLITIKNIGSGESNYQITPKGKKYMKEEKKTWHKG